jgi:hypothetical protein
MSEEQTVIFDPVERALKAERERDEAIAREAQLRRTLDERAISEGTRLMNERIEREQLVTAEREKAERKTVLPRPRTWPEWATLTTAQKAECISLYPNAQQECLDDKRIRDKQAQRDEVARRLAAARPVYQRE